MESKISFLIVPLFLLVLLICFTANASVSPMDGAEVLNRAESPVAIDGPPEAESS